MIRFACKLCGEHVRVPDTSGGRKGRCPFCKRVIEIPARSTVKAPAGEGRDDMSSLAAAVSGEPPPEPEPVEAPRPPRPDDVSDAERELELALATDPSNRTDKLIAISEGESLDAHADKPETGRQMTPRELSQLAQRAAEVAAKRAMKRGVLIGVGIVVVVLVGLIAALVVWAGWRSHANQASKNSPAATTQVAS
jgi:hypothetical protein